MRFLLCLFSVLTLCNAAYSADGIHPYKMSAADKAALERVETYLSGIHRVSAEFIQSDPNGSISTGKFYLERPGKLRMEYAPPTPVLMVATGGYIIYYDKELDQVSRILLDSTLVGFLAREHVKFDNTVVITNMMHNNDMLEISLIQAKHPMDGTLTLDFSDKPLVLHTMIVKDSSGQITTVALNNAHFNMALDESLFVFKDPHLGGRRGIRN